MTTDGMTTDATTPTRMHVTVATETAYTGRCECGHCGEEFVLTVSERDAQGLARDAPPDPEHQTHFDQTMRWALDAGWSPEDAERSARAICGDRDHARRISPADAVRAETRRRALAAGFTLGPDGAHALCVACKRGLDAGEWTPDE